MNRKPVQIFKTLDTPLLHEASRTF